MKKQLKTVCVACLIGTALAGPAASASDPGRSPIPDTWKGRGIEVAAPRQTDNTAIFTVETPLVGYAIPGEGEWV